jgi:hypothetical protein
VLKLFQELGRASCATALLLSAVAPLRAADIDKGRVETFDVTSWLADLEQARGAFRTKYANLEWLENEREINLDALFADLATRLKGARNEADARAVFERLVTKTGDGHVEIEWVEPAVSSSTQAPVPPADPCAVLGFDARQNNPGIAVYLPGYAPIKSDTNVFRTGIASVAGTKLGIIRISVFQPQAFPQLCRAAMSALRISSDQACGERCQDEIIGWTYPRLTAALEDRTRELTHAGATALLIDITDNGGGSEWAEAVARIFSRKQLLSERRGMVRGEHWAAQWRDLAKKLQDFAFNARGKENADLLHWAAAAAAKLREARTACEPNARCERIADAGFSTGLLASASSNAFAGKAWGPLVFSPAQFPYHDGVWSGPLLVLVNQETWSAAEEFAAVLQDNRAAVIVGTRTGGAGCGHTNGGDPVLLRNSKAVLKLPDCVRYRIDGSNEVRGIIPDVVVPIRANDGAHLRAQLIAQRLPEAIARARRLLLRPSAARRAGLSPSVRRIEIIHSDSEVSALGRKRT